jgi:hypothetical protein
MTKARLQAEAAERHDDHAGSFDQKRVSPLDFDPSGSESRERAMSRDSTGLNQGRLHRGQTSDSMSSIPSMVQVNPTNRDIPQTGRQPQASPLPPGFQNFGPQNASLCAFLDSAEAHGRSGSQDRARIPNTPYDNVQHPSKGEAWESASVTSHNSTVVSEYLGSESAFSTGAGGRMPQPPDEMVGIHFNRVRSYTANAALGTPYEIPSPTSDGFSRGGIFFDAAVGGPNRLRSYTLSPQPGLIHEDRPHFSGETLGIPSFSSGGRRGSLSRSRHNYSPVMPHMSSESMRFGYNSGLGDGSNRPRTSSTTSLPPMSHTAEEFALDRPIPSSRFLASQPFLGTGPISEEGLPGLAGGVFDYPYVSTGREGPADFTGSESVFRDVPNSNNLPPPPPGMFGNKGQILSGSTSSLAVNFSRVGSMDSVAETRVSSAWDGSGGDLLRSRAGGIDEMLSSDLGSILKLSGATDRHDRDQSN